MQRFVIMGAAGRKQDAAHVSVKTFQWIVDKCRVETSAEDTLISGGAAFADHAAVVLALTRGNPLVLELPAPWDSGQKRYQATSAGRISNYYHEQFPKACGQPAHYTLHQLDAALRLPNTEKHESNGFFQRNSLVAESCDKMLAFVLHYPTAAGPSGGTGNPWRKCS